jgi:hypothetical protein
MQPLLLRGVIAPALIALAIAADFFDLLLRANAMGRLGLVFLALGLVFAKDTRRLCAGTLLKAPRDPAAEDLDEVAFLRRRERAPSATFPNMGQSPWNQWSQRKQKPSARWRENSRC